MATDSRSSELLRQRGIWAIFLVGFMGAGKTTIGIAIAKRLGWRFVDLDDELEAQAGRSIAEIFRTDGEAEFRRLEIDVLNRLSGSGDWREGTVAALGGGAFVQVEIRAVIRTIGQPSVFLDAPVNELLVRCRNSTVERPLAKDEEQFRQLYASRRDAYAKADLQVSTAHRSQSKTAKAVVDELVSFTGRKTAAAKRENKRGAPQ